MRWRSASLVLRVLLPLRARARETVIFDTPRRAATSAMVTARGAGAGWPCAAAAEGAFGGASRGAVGRLLALDIWYRAHKRIVCSLQYAQALGRGATGKH
jgi:hypothetical protein